ncbi:hypothetical protein IIM_00201 [Bacillus cereus VD107]|nr:hypothetical protein IIM_00201 [Bacillus cereus VD107]
MRIPNYLFTLFERTDFTYRKEDTDIREDYEPKWLEWRSIVENKALSKTNNRDLELDRRPEGWQNSGHLKDRFWTRIKHRQKYSSSSNISVMINKKNLRIYLEWHNYKAGKDDYSENTVEEHNQWVNFVKQWIDLLNIPIDMYKVWVSNEDDHGNYISLGEFVNNNEIRESKLEIIKKKPRLWIRVGAVIPKEEALKIPNIDEFIARRINEISWILEQTLYYPTYKDKRFWLFNVYYSRNQKIWEKSRQMGVAAMQYEKERQNPTSVTRNINIANQISEDDFIVAYTGKQGFLGLGQINHEFYNENDPAKFITEDGEHWRQRLGVNWFNLANSPVYYRKKGFKDKIGLLNEKTVMGSSTIFEISLEGYLFIKHLLKESLDDGIYGGKSMFESFGDYVKARGFSFNQDILNNYILSLMSKPFVILSGISGTGKTKIAQFFAEYMCPDEKREIVDNQQDASYIYKIQEYNKKYNKYTIPKRFEMYIDLPPNGETTEVTVRVEETVEKCKLYSARNGRYVQLYFSGKVSSYIKDNYQIGDNVRVTFEKEDGIPGDIISFKRDSVVSKEITVRSNRYLFLSVRPDWMDNKSLLGFYNPITEEYQSTELLKLLIRASMDLSRPYFVVFDEMNLAKVEYYFSDFLSCLESRRVGEDGVLRSEAIHLHDNQPISIIDEYGNELIIPSKLEIPKNVYFTGTVNIDETTYMFSPKVLDRANVIEFNHVDLDNYEIRLKDTTINESDLALFANEKFIESFTDERLYHNRLIKKDFIFDDEVSASYKKIQEIHRLLIKHKLHFGYRVVDEILFYLSNARESRIFSAEDALDNQILQRILPKFHGNRKKLEQPLSKLLAYSFGIEGTELENYKSLLTVDKEYLEGWIDNVELSEEHSSIFANRDPLLPKTAHKVFEMLKALQENGFVSYIQ